NTFNLSFHDALPISHVGVDGQLPRAVPGEPAHPAARGVRRPARPQDPEVAGECSNECGGAACGPSRFYFEARAAVTTRGFLFRRSEEHTSELQSREK